MLRILFDDVPAPGALDLLRLAAAPSLEAIATVLLGGPKAIGSIGEGVEAAMEQLVAGFGRGAAAAILDQLPPDVRPLVTDADGGLSPEFGLWLTDCRGNFAAVVAEREALIGTGPEFAQLLASSAHRLARQVAADPSAPAEARYEAAMVVRPRLTVVS